MIHINFGIFARIHWIFGAMFSVYGQSGATLFLHRCSCSAHIHKNLRVIFLRPFFCWFLRAFIAIGRSKQKQQ